MSQTEIFRYAQQSKKAFLVSYTIALSSNAALRQHCSELHDVRAACCWLM